MAEGSRQHGACCQGKDAVQEGASGAHDGYASMSAGWCPCKNLRCSLLAEVGSDVFFVEFRLQKEGIVPLGGVDAFVLCLHAVFEQFAVEEGNLPWGEAAIRIDGENHEADAVPSEEPEGFVHAAQPGECG